MDLWAAAARPFSFLFEWWTTTLIACLVALIISASWWREGKQQSPALDIQPCPNPNCVRCRRYAEVNAEAQRKLNWVVKEFDIQRVVRAVRLGIQQPVRSNTISPIPGQHPTVLLVGGLPTEPVVTHLHRDICELLQNNYDAVLKEYKSVFGKWTVNDGDWKVLHIMNQGVWNKEHAVQFPKTIQMIQPYTMHCLFGNVFFSILKPGSKIEPHCGPTNARHRLQFCLESGDEGATLTVASTTLTWTKGQAFCFDDSLPHSASYSASRGSPRVVLIVDLWHPYLSFGERHAIQQLYPGEL